MNRRDLRPLPAEPVSVHAPFDVRRPLVPNPDAAWADREAAIREALAGVELGDYDQQLINWFAGWDVATVGTLVSLIERARAAGRPHAVPGLPLVTTLGPRPVMPSTPGRGSVHQPREQTDPRTQWRWSGGFWVRYAGGDAGESTGTVGGITGGWWPPGVALPVDIGGAERPFVGNEHHQEEGDHMSVTVEQFASDPLAPVSAQLALSGSTFTERRTDEPSPVGVRPWGLRRARPATGPGRVLPAWRYDEQEQMAVEIASGLPLIVAGDPSADTTETTDGEDGPSSEDWDND